MNQKQMNEIANDIRSILPVVANLTVQLITVEQYFDNEALDDYDGCGEYPTPHFEESGTSIVEVMFGGIGSEKVVVRGSLQHDEDLLSSMVITCTNDYYGTHVVTHMLKEDLAINRRACHTANYEPVFWNRTDVAEVEREREEEIRQEIIAAHEAKKVNTYAAKFEAMLAN